MGERYQVRAAREVVSPNVWRVFDLVEAAGHPEGWQLEVAPFPGWEGVPTW